MSTCTTNPWKTTTRGGCPDWSEIQERIDLGIVVTGLLGPAPGRRGEKGRRHWWHCPLGTHEDRNPSFAVDPVKRRWRCFGCGEHGDAARLAMRLRGWTFPDAVRWLAELAAIANPSGSRKLSAPRRPAAKPGKAASAAPEKPSGLPVADALSLVTEAAGRLWAPEGAGALGYLRARGLVDHTIKATRLGWTPGASIPNREGTRFWTVRGIVIPWLDGDRLALVKVRRPEGREPRYAEVYRDRPGIYPGAAIVKPGRPLVVVEGELDALLLGHTLGNLAAVVTLGPASVRPEESTHLAMLPAPIWYLAHDADAAGDKAAMGWPARAIRVRPPGPNKDWTEAAQAGVSLGRWWTDRLGGTEAPRLFAWEELSTWRWGPAIGGPEPGHFPSGKTASPRAWYNASCADPAVA